MTVRVDGYTRFILTVIALLLGVVAVGMWGPAPNTTPAAQAALPSPGEQLNPGRQLDEMVKNSDQLNQALAELQKLLVSGAVKVQVVDPSQVQPTPPPPPATPPVIKDTKVIK
jgi:hypothetical protein